jgi:tetratricopeptide (TPR) repeat protein
MGKSKFLYTVFILLLIGCSSVHKQIEKGDYDLVISRYALTMDRNDPEINYQVAEAYRLSNRIQESEPYYAAAVNAGVIEQEAYYYYARALKANKKYDEARKML